MTDSSFRTAAHFPGGRMTPGDWSTLAGVAARHGGEVVLTPRGGIRVRRAGGDTVPRDRLVAEGLPRRIGDHRLPRILASPMAGRIDGHHDLADLPERLDAELAARLGDAGPAGATDPAPSGARLLIGLDAGAGDVLAHTPDLAAVAGGAGDALRVHAAGRDTAVGIGAADAAAVLADVTAELARRLDDRPGVPDSGDLHDLVVVILDGHPLTVAVGSPAPLTTPAEIPRVGWIDSADGLVSLLAVVADGVVPARLAEFLGAVDRPSTVSPDRVIGLHGLTEGMAEQVVRVLAPMGMIFDATSPWADPTRSA